MSESLKWIDNIGNSIQVGHLVFLYTGITPNTIHEVKKLSVRVDELYGNITIIVLEDGRCFYPESVLSLTALGIDEAHIDYRFMGQKGYDALGHKISLGDKILYVHRMDSQGSIGIAKKFTDKTCLMTIEENRFGQTEYRKKYHELISLNAIGKQDIFVKNNESI